MPGIDLSLLSNDDDSDTGYLDPDLMAQQDALAQRKALLVQAAKDSANQVGVYAPVAAQQQPGWTSAVVPPGASSGAHMLAPLARTSFLQAAAPLVADAALGMRQSQYNEDLSGYNRLSQAAVSDHMANKPDDDAPISDKLQWAQQGAQIPAIAPLMKDYAKDQLIAEPDRVAARQDKLTQAAADRAQRAQTAKDAQQERLQQAQLIAAAMGGRQKQVTTDSDGNLIVVDKRDNSSTPVTTQDANGNQTSVTRFDAATKAQQRANADSVTRARLGTNIMNEVDSLLAGTAKDANGKPMGTPTSSILGADVIDPAYRLFGASNKGMEANAPIKKLSAWLATTTPTGSVRTNMARQQAIEAVGNLEDPSKSLGEKRAAAKTVRESIAIMTDPASYADPVTRTPGNPPPLNTDNSVPVPGSTMLRQPAPSSNKVRVYNPATRSLE